MRASKNKSPSKSRSACFLSAVLLGTASIFFVPALSVAQETAPTSEQAQNEQVGLDLEAALIRAYLNNPTLNASRMAVQVEDEGLSEARAGANPVLTVDGRVDWTQTRQRPGQNFSGTPKRVGLGLAQPLYRGGRISASVNRAENRIMAERERLRDTEQNVLYSATEAYFNVVRDRAIIALRDKNVEVLTEQMDATKQGFEVGEFTRTDVSQSVSRLERSKADRIRAQNNLQTSMAVFNQIVGEVDGDSAQLVTKNYSLKPPETLQQAIDFGLQNHPVIGAALFDKHAASDDVDFFTGELLPEVNIIGEVSRTYDPVSGGGGFNNNNLNEQDNALIGVGVSMPLYDGGVSRARIRAAKRTTMQREEELHIARRDVEQRVIRAWSDYTAAKSRLTAIQKQIEAAEMALEGVLLERELGTRTVLDTLDAEQEVLDARVAYVEGERDLVVAQFSVMAAMGELNARQLSLNTAYYDPESHYNKARGKIFSTD